MKKTLLIAAAALAAGVISSQAQAVYSQNIVGYVNVPSPVGYAAFANPLSNGNNSATNFLDTTSGNSDGTIVLTWTGTKYAQAAIDSTSATGFSNPANFAPVPAPILAPGQGFLLNNLNASNTVTFVGTVAVGGPGASTNVVGITTNVLGNATTYVIASSVLPIGGGISSVLGLTNPGGAIDGSVVLVPNVVSGSIHGYTQTAFDSTSGTGFSNPANFAPLPEPVIPVGSSFLFNNQSGAPINWVQSL
jgi:hypothetical protein